MSSIFICRLHLVVLLIVIQKKNFFPLSNLSSIFIFRLHLVVLLIFIQKKCFFPPILNLSSSSAGRSHVGTCYLPGSEKRQNRLAHDVFNKAATSVTVQCHTSTSLIQTAGHKMARTQVVSYCQSKEEGCRKPVLGV